MHLTEIVFSPTGGTQAVLEAFSAAWPEERDRVDLTRRRGGEAPAFGPDSLCLVAVPSYGGRVPAPAARRLAELRGNGAAAVLLAVYGNRAYEDTLTELKDLLSGAGFRCVAAVAAVARHSIVPQIAAGRPHEEDRRELEEFGRRVRAYWEAGGTAEVEVPGNRPYRAYGGLPMHPKAGPACTRCGRCAQACPAEAIPAEDPTRTDKSRCITCMRCVVRCPRKARALPPPLVWAAAQKLKSSGQQPKQNELFLPQKQGEGKDRSMETRCSYV